jgi:biopolymer transport protein ExbD
VLLRRALRKDAIIIDVKRDSKVFYANDLVVMEALPSRILESLRHGSEPKAYLRVDSRAKYRVVKDVLDSVRSAGIQNISFFTRPSSEVQVR